MTRLEEARGVDANNCTKSHNTAKKKKHSKKIQTATILQTIRVEYTHELFKLI